MNVSQPLNSNKYPIKVMAFTASKGRPIMLRGCCLQMKAQSYPVTHAVYNNGPDNPYNHYNYLELLQDIESNSDYKLIATFGEPRHQHFNYIYAISQINVNDYDLFLKIDDDDYYHLDYVKSTVEDFLQYQWDFSGTYSPRIILGDRIGNNARPKSLGLQEEDIELKVDEFFPPTMAFSRKGIQEIIDIDIYNPDRSDMWEDMIWRRAIYSNPNLKKRIRPDGHFIYNRHDKSFSQHGITHPKVIPSDK